MLVSYARRCLAARSIFIVLAATALFTGLLALTPRAYAQDPDFTGDCTASTDAGDCGITSYVQVGINILTALVGVVIAISIAAGGVQYMMAQDNPQAVEAARERIRNAIIALVAFIFTYAFLQYLVPGGVF